MKQQGLPRGPSESADEQVRRWIEAPTDFWEECAREYGPVVTLELGSLGTVILVSDPSSVADVFALPREAYEVRQYNDHYRYVMGPESVLVADGERHRRQRNLLTPPMHPGRLMPEFPEIARIARSTVDDWPIGEPFNPRPGFHVMTFAVMVGFLLGSLKSDTALALISLYREDVASQVGSWGPWRRFAKLHSRFGELLADEIEARRGTDRPGVLTRFAQAEDEDGSPITDTEVLNHVFTFFVAGVDTTAISLSWALYWLSRERDARDRLVGDLPGAGRELTPIAVDIPYLDAVFRETLRMYPVVPTPAGRKLTRDATIGEHTFPVGTTLLPCTYLVHRREDLFPDPDRFAPERFLDRTYRPHEYFPFGGGHRTCVGRHFAPFEFKIALATVLMHRELADWIGSPITPTRHGILLAPSDDFRIRVSPRSATPDVVESAS